MIALDEALVRIVNEPAGASPVVDQGIYLVAQLDLFKAVVGVAVLVAVIVQVHDRWGDAAVVLLRSAAGALVATFLVRISQELLPHRLRPVVADIGVTPVEALDASGLAAAAAASSFPSDHAAIMFALATATFAVSRSAGRWLALYSAVVVMLPRVYLGFHYVSDILVGAAAGVAITAAVMAVRVPPTLESRIGRWAEAHRGLSALIAVVVLQQVSVLFEGIRTVLDALGL